MGPGDRCVIGVSDAESTLPKYLARSFRPNLPPAVKLRSRDDAVGLGLYLAGPGMEPFIRHSSAAMLVLEDIATFVDARSTSA
eukprot:scaffold29938_cov118-Isochrysis_galbana.AAC.3